MVYSHLIIFKIHVRKYAHCNMQEIKRKQILLLGSDLKTMQFSNITGIFCLVYKPI